MALPLLGRVDDTSLVADKLSRYVRTYYDKSRWHTDAINSTALLVRGKGGLLLVSVSTRELDGKSLPMGEAPLAITYLVESTLLVTERYRSVLDVRSSNRFSEDMTMVLFSSRDERLCSVLIALDVSRVDPFLLNGLRFDVQTIYLKLFAEGKAEIRYGLTGGFVNASARLLPSP